MLLLLSGLITIVCFVITACVVANKTNSIAAAEDDAQEAYICEWKTIHEYEQKRKMK